jgi:membrane protease YdiL (CAAX protease family)
LKRYPAAFFFILAYGMTWMTLVFRSTPLSQLVYGIAAFSPAISAIIMTIANEGKAGFRKLTSRLFLWRVRIKWYLIALLAPIALEFLGIFTHGLLGDTTPALRFEDWIRMVPAQLPGLFLFLLMLMILASGEELGWRGYAMPQLQARFGSIGASLILGSLWGLWHLPMFLIPGTAQYGLPVIGYVLATIGYTFIYTCIYNGTKGSILLAILYHAASNLILIYGNAISPKIISNLYLTLPALAILIVIVILVSGPKALVGRQSLPNKDAA